MTEVQSQLSVESLRHRSYQSQLSLIKEITAHEGFRAFLLSYESDGLEVFARINIPSGDVPPHGFPVVVFAHGFSPNPADPDYFQRPYYEAWVNAYAKQGYLVIMPGYRGHGVIDGEKADGGEYIDRYADIYLTSPFYAIDMLNLMATLPSLPLLNWTELGTYSPNTPLADEKNIFLSAHSMGGDVALILLATNQQFNAASIWAGVCADMKDVAAFYTQYSLKESQSDSSFETIFEAEWHKVTSTAKEAPFHLDDVNDANGFFFLQSIKTPLILHQGMEDSAVSPDWSVTLHKNLSELGLQNILHLYEGNNHELSLNEAHSLAIQRDVEFFNKHRRTE